MASNRYGRIYHGNHHYNNIKFPSADAREQFAEKVKKYHDSHDHDGEAPRFEFLKASEIKSYDRGPKAVDQVTIDGYTSNEIKKYHNREHPDTYTHYRVPTCCLSPIIVLDREFIDAGTLKRHELSSIFGDMPETDFENLVKSVEQDGFMDSLIRVLDGKVLDGWHRYRAAVSLNLVRKLMFMHWDAEKEGKAVAFVAARNIERRHLSASQRAQIVVSLNERFGWGGDRSKTPNDALKSKAELAAQAKVGISSIDRAVKVEKLGKAESVISGEKSSAQVIVEENVNDLWEQVSAEIPEWKRRDTEKCEYESDHIGRASKSMLIQALRSHQDSDADGAATVEELKNLLELIKVDALSFIIEVRQVLKGSQQPVESKSGTADDREASKLLKKKTQVLKSMWDARIQAATDYTGEANTELNQTLTLPQLEKGFARHHPYLKDAFNSGMKRITSAFTYSIFLQNIDVPLEDLENECRSITTYAHDIFRWKGEEWIQDMIRSKKSVPSPPDAEPEPEPDTLEVLWEKVRSEMPAWKERYKKSGKRESNIVSSASRSMLIQTLRVYRKSDEGSGAATVDELKDLLKLMKSDTFVFIYHLRKAFRDPDASEPETPEAEAVESCQDDETDSETSAEDTSLDDLNLSNLKGVTRYAFGDCWES